MNKTPAKQLKNFSKKRKFQEIRLHILLISELTSTIYQHHHCPLCLGEIVERVQCFARTSESFPPNGVPAAESFSSFARVQRRLLLVLFVIPPHFPGCLTRSKV